MDWSGVDYCGIFISCLKISFWRHPFTAEDPLLSKWCNATFLQIWRNKLKYMMDGLRARTLSAYFHFLMNNCYSFIEMTKKWQHFGTIGHFFIDIFATLICVRKAFLNFLMPSPSGPISIPQCYSFSMCSNVRLLVKLMSKCHMS